MAKLFNAGDHDPIIPFSEEVGNAFNVDPLHIGSTSLKVGVIVNSGLKTTVIVSSTGFIPQVAVTL